MSMTHHTPSASDAQIETGAQWRRLSAVSIVHFVFVQLKNIAQSLIYAVPALAISFNTGSAQHVDKVVLGLLVLIAVFLMFGGLKYWFYVFRIHNRHIEIKSGVLKKSHVNLPFWRVQNIKIEQPIYYRPFGFARVILDTAGSAREEAELIAVRLPYAQQLKATVLEDNVGGDGQSEGINSRRVSGDAADGKTSTKDERVLNRRSLKDLFIHGVTNNRVWILLGALAPFLDSGTDALIRVLENNGIGVTQWLSGADTQWWQIGMGVIALTLVVMGCLALLSVIGSILIFYGYVLVKQGDRYIRRSGLLNVQEVSVRASRIQLALAKQDWLDVLLGRINLYFEQNAPRFQTPDMTTGKLLIPSVTQAESIELLSEVLPGNNLEFTTFQPIAGYFFSYYLKMWLIVVASVFSVAALINPSLWLIVYALLAVMLITIGLYLRFRRWGWAIDNAFVYLRRGFFGIDRLCFQPFKVQQVIVKQSVFMKWKGVCSVTCILASGAITLPFLPQNEAYGLVNRLLYDVESTKRSWM